MNNFSGTQEFDGIRNLRYIADYSENIVISRTGFLLCSKILEQISDRITFTLKFTCIKWYATCCLWPDSHCVIDIIRSESGFLNFLHGKVPGKLMYNSGYHFQMTEFFCSYVVEQSRSRPVRHGKTLGKITQGSADLTVRATRVQYPIIVPQAQRLCGFAGFLVRGKHYKYVKKAEMTLFMDG